MIPRNGRSAIRGQRSEGSTQKNLAVRLYGKAAHDTLGVRIETLIDGAIQVKPRDIVAGPRCESSHRRECRESAAHNNAAVRLPYQRVDRRVRIGIENRIERSVRIDSSNSIAGNKWAPGEKAGEFATDDNVSVGLHRDGMNRAVGMRVERRVDGAVGI